MSCSLHSKIFVHLRTEGKLVPLTAFFEDFHSYGYRIPEPLDTGLGLFGNFARSDFPPLTCLNPGWPVFLSENPFAKLLDSIDIHTKMWCRWDDFNDSVEEYSEAIKDKKLFLSLFPGENFKNAFSSKFAREDVDHFLVELKKFITDVDYALNKIENYIDRDSPILLTWMDS
jgi:hypothetical protein